MSERKSPEESANLFDIGKVKKGLDGNKWQVVKNKNGIKRWIRCDKSETKKKTSNFFGKKYNKSKSEWYRGLPQMLKNSIDSMRSSYGELEKLGFRVFEYILHINTDGIYFIDELWEAFNKRYPNAFNEKHPYLISIIKIDANNAIDLGENISICLQHLNVKHAYKKQIIEYIKKFNDFHSDIQMSWNGNNKHVISYEFKNIIRYSTI